MRNLVGGTRYSASLLSGIAILLINPVVAVGQQPGGGLTITNVGVNYNDATIFISGEQLDFGPGPLTVLLGPADISALCELLSPEEIECDLGDNGGLPPNADYLLIVANGNGQGQSDEYDLTIRDARAIGDPANTYTNSNQDDSVANNKNVAAECDEGDLLLSGGAGLGPPSIRSELAECVAIWSSLPQGGGDVWRSFASEVPGASDPDGCFDQVGLPQNQAWRLETRVVCLNTINP